MRFKHLMVMTTALPALVLVGTPFGQSAWSQSRGGPGIDVPGLRFHVKPEDLPRPHATPSVGNGANRTVKPSETPLQVPEGFRVNLFAGDLDHVRWMTVADNGDVLLAEPQLGKITLLRDSDGDGQADVRATFLRGLNQPHGLAVHQGYLYIGEPTRIVRVPYRPGDLKPTGKKEVVGGRGSLGGGGGHWTRNIVFAPDGKSFYVSVGSRHNVDVEAEPRATVQRFEMGGNGADGSGQTTFATGLRNPVGIDFHPDTGELYVVVNERDGLGDGLVPDYLTRVREGEFFGWPYAYIGANPDPDYGDEGRELIATTVVPDVLFQSHSAPLGLVFYDGGMFPEAFRGDAFVALHGSWNASQPTGYKVVRVPFKNGRPQSWYENLAVGFWSKGRSPARVWGRPAGLAIAQDGSLLIADDVDQSIWRVSYGE